MNSPLCPAGTHPAFGNIVRSSTGARYCRACKKEDSLDRCPKGHSLSANAVWRSDGSGNKRRRCGECERERSRRRRVINPFCSNGHVYEQVGFTRAKNGKRLCSACDRAAQAAEAAKARFRASSTDATWYDWVAVDRAVAGVPVGRPLCPLEVKEVVARTWHLTKRDVARNAGVGEAVVERWRRLYPQEQATAA